MQNVLKLKPGGDGPPRLYRDLAFYFAGILTANFGAGLLRHGAALLDYVHAPLGG